MASNPLAVSRLGEEDSREAQNARAVRWLLEQPGGPVVVVTPSREVPNGVLRRLVTGAGVSHLTRRGFVGGSFEGRRVLFAWPDRKGLNDVWAAEADALVVIEWNEDETSEWREDARPVELWPGETSDPGPKPASTLPPLPDDVARILEHIASMAASYDSGLKWNEEDRLKADMMHRPERWAHVSVEQVRVKCRELGMQPKDVDTVSGLLQRCKDGRRFNVRSSYRNEPFPF